MKSKLLISSTPLRRTTVLSLRSNGHSQTRMCILKIIDGHVGLQFANYPTSTELAGIDMRFDEEAVRELHGHREMEWAYMPWMGGCRCTILDDGGAYEANRTKRNIWYAPSFYSGCQQGWVRVHANGNSSEDKIFLLSNWLAHTPKGVMAKNFGLDPSVFDKLSQKGDESDDSHIVRGVTPDTSSPGLLSDVPKSEHRFMHCLLAQLPSKIPGNTVRIADTLNFPVPMTSVAVHVTVEPHGLRELHWHPNADEWSFFVRSRTRVSVSSVECDITLIGLLNIQVSRQIGPLELNVTTLLPTSKYHNQELGGSIGHSTYHRAPTSSTRGRQSRDVRE